MILLVALPQGATWVEVAWASLSSRRLRLFFLWVSHPELVARHTVVRLHQAELRTTRIASMPTSLRRVLRITLISKERQQSTLPQGKPQQLAATAWMTT